MKNEIIISINPDLYSLEAVYGAAYVFLDSCYVFLDGDIKKEIKVYLKNKDSSSIKISKLKGEFLNELLSCSLRDKISKNNKKMREYIVAAALIGSSEKEDLNNCSQVEEGWEEDPLSIAVPWEDKFGKKEG